MKTKELKNLSTEDLVQKEKSFKKELFELNFKRRMGNVEKPARFKQLRRDIARVLTIIKERELKDNGSNR
jgi:large subunit ribosomal protein L29